MSSPLILINQDLLTVKKPKALLLRGFLVQITESRVFST
ncbi:hypothetical protein GXM_07985 [Nostoc sphaeroides CCNUC1]|uniref:Uncharacterized protein n=1 Tax=Nostoc sphaeroides CCNUC1 TaxID=2653204 RepID=A0A5P8WD35_9NOSO|nr:hypothetical protein GXM_07985 [Nostoc sphaeroides CCNUC1]